MKVEPPLSKPLKIFSPPAEPTIAVPAFVKMTPPLAVSPSVISIVPVGSESTCPEVIVPVGPKITFDPAVAFTNAFVFVS